MGVLTNHLGSSNHFIFQFTEFYAIPCAHSTVETGGLPGDQVSPNPKAHGCILFNYIFEAQAGQLAISNSCSVLQEQEHNQGQAVHCKRSYLLPGTKNLRILVEAVGNWYLPIFHHQKLYRSRKSTVGTSLFHSEASVNKPNQVLTCPPLPIVWTRLSGGCCYSVHPLFPV
jgi:hypothetical protein